ncbi:MAG: fibronectin type III domain-containing protein [Planctomycetes bacterium]|nr:fibronectin type III domain-containing protein [Planctomycetota bacterium]
MVATAVSSSQINLTWQHNATNAKEYVVERKDNYHNYAPIAWVSLLSDSETPGLQINFSDTGLIQDTTYTYRVQCYNEAGHSDYSNEHDALTWLEAPSNLSVHSASTAQVDISWTNNSPAAEGFTIERMDVYHKFIPIATVGYGVTSYSDTGLEQNTRYNYRVQAHKTGNTSDYSQETYGDTMQLTTGYIMDSLKHYYQNGQIKNYGIYNSLVSKLQSAHDAMMRGDWNAYQNKMQAFIKEVDAQAGKGVEQQAAAELKQEGGTVSVYRAEIKGPDGKSPPHPFLPVCMPVTFTVILPPISGTWGVTATDSSDVDIQGDTSGTTSPSGPATRTFTVHAKQSSVAINIEVSVTPTKETGVPVVHTAPAISTTFGTTQIFRPGYRLAEVITDTTISPTRVTINGPPIAISGSATIHLTMDSTPVPQAYIDAWQLGFLQNVISSTKRYVYSPPTPSVTVEKQLNPNLVPALDHFGLGVPMTHYGTTSFSADGQTKASPFGDEPGIWIDTQDSNGTLSEMYTEDIFITWFIAKNTITGEIRYLYWWKWRHIQHIKYNSATGQATKQDDTGIVHDPSQDEGENSAGTERTGVTPSVGPPLAKDFINKDNSWTKTQ